MIINKYLSIFLLYLATVFYTSASYIHLAFKPWTFSKAYLFAIPIILIEYIFKIFGTKYSSDNGLNIVQIMLLVIAFYMINVWIINYLFLQHDINYGREGIVLILIILAILISSNILVI